MNLCHFIFHKPNYEQMRPKSRLNPKFTAFLFFLKEYNVENELRSLLDLQVSPETREHENFYEGKTWWT